MNLWVWLLGVVVRRYIDFLILLIPTPLFFAAASQMFFVLIYIIIMGRMRLMLVCGLGEGSRVNYAEQYKF